MRKLLPAALISALSFTCGNEAADVPRAEDEVVDDDMQPFLFDGLLWEERDVLRPELQPPPEEFRP